MDLLKGKSSKEHAATEWTFKQMFSGVNLK